MSRIQVFDAFGRYIVDVLGAASREWILNDVGAGQVRLSQYERREIFRIGNILLIEHNVLPTWCGMITEIDFSNIITLHAKSIEIVLDYIPTQPGETLSGNSAKIFAKLIETAGAWGWLPFRVGTVESDGNDREETLTGSVLEHVLRVAERSGSEIEIVPLVENQQLVLVANIFQRRGRYYGEIIESRDLERSDRIITLGGDVFNYIHGIGDTSTSASRPESIAVNHDSISRYGPRGKNVVFTGNSNPATVARNAEQLLKELSEPRASINASLARELPVRLGDTVLLRLHSGFGYESLMRIIAMRYDDEMRKTELALQEMR